MAAGIAWLELRTTAPAEAARFYAEVVGLDLRELDGRSLVIVDEVAVGEISELPVALRERGVPANWLTRLSVEDLPATLTAVEAVGAVRLGPTRRSPEGFEFAALFDPFQAALALTTQPPAPLSRVLWHDHHSHDHPAATRFYAEHLGLVPVGADSGKFQAFAWAPGQPVAGALTSAAQNPLVHDQWLTAFEVEDFDARVAGIQARGGVVVGTFSLPDGSRFSPCDDPQGAAFGLRERRPS
ncbi:hypothetical protein G6O69_34240 [Pseudenhygromyxa sp. WMMC2535]|uniref:VOC family protein n=1 Tax=Pseudenhygromyxa sp. WMMC2535 TaxID=2712867 RepID=UPI0015573FB2|nr:VOC family protein [Pseudenhygromyxa sp. WMMC2535]NVB42932.1 hypothetical protein [Pseudenhygromyxa sp. WMMC2535]